MCNELPITDAQDTMSAEMIEELSNGKGDDEEKE